jgi:hypothetical protein
MFCHRFVVRGLYKVTYHGQTTQCRIISLAFCCSIDLQIESKSKVNYPQDCFACETSGKGPKPVVGLVPEVFRT